MSKAKSILTTTQLFTTGKHRDDRNDTNCASVSPAEPSSVSAPNVLVGRLPSVPQLLVFEWVKQRQVCFLTFVYVQMCTHVCVWQQRPEGTDLLVLLAVGADPNVSPLQEPYVLWTARKPGWSEDGSQDGLTATLTQEALVSVSVLGFITGLWTASCYLAFIFCI